MKKILVGTFVLSSLFFANANELSLDEVKKIASKASSQFNSKLKKELKKVKRAGGTKAMTDFCINDSMKILEEQNKKLSSKIKIKRVSLNSRNIESKALKDEENILKAFDLIQKSDAYLPKQIVQVIDDNIYKVYSPIEMKSRDCKKCHGLEKKVDKESRKKFSQIYKNNKAYDYKSGDVRGAVIVTISN